MDPVTNCHPKLYREPEVSDVIRLKRLQWAGHVTRMEKEQGPRRVLEANFGGRRAVGRPRG